MYTFAQLFNPALCVNLLNIPYCYIPESRMTFRTAESLLWFKKEIRCRAKFLVRLNPISDLWESSIFFADPNTHVFSMKQRVQLDRSNKSLYYLVLTVELDLPIRPREISRVCQYRHCYIIVCRLVRIKFSISPFSLCNLAKINHSAVWIFRNNGVLFANVGTALSSAHSSTPLFHFTRYLADVSSHLKAADWIRAQFG